jgi:hypoxanthine-guanine phosphoribosyltransferase
MVHELTEDRLIGVSKQDRKVKERQVLSVMKVLTNGTTLVTFRLCRKNFAQPLYGCRLLARNEVCNRNRTTESGNAESLY